MFKTKLKQTFWIILICFINKHAFALTGEEISSKVSDWLITEGVIGTPVFSKNSKFKDCNNKIEIKKMFQNYNTIKVNCSDKNGFELLMRIEIIKKKEIKKTIKHTKGSKFHHIKKVSKKKTQTFKIIKLKRSLEKNDIIKLGDIETSYVNKKNKTSFFSNQRELIGRKLKKNLKMGQILHPRHLYEKFDINNGDIISIMSNVGNASVSVSGEAKDSGNFGDLIKVKNLKSGKIVKGYVKKNKIIKIFR